jgi:hypothetical protein
MTNTTPADPRRRSTALTLAAGMAVAAQLANRPQGQKKRVKS